ncbi:MAG: TIGR03576 family pyridoxal phosphate-dependent enzyme [Methanobrevibacter ruminantium]|uniref:TIGR03576 family pyridoxal phosphate-dependent enzyme n=1 Tax=Methanobrevibacter ruminantium TaxID=83816 RepID=UPI0026EDE472|nr:TIGR03576 family pyridoxal phosphate-dependent enzyme [Methanobrevibacter ruminantium]MCI5737846.1 TIGR03576 family pyridoxal phosphate-dependent enzyme [Methanobrevibacter ruminantium]MDD6048106.1 TIGR03576 family pyridoxal phosphate-dependent enzyme [Methanobrevibacter ruminantium]
MIVNNSLDEVRKRESALKIIKEIINDNGRDSLYDVTGLSGGFIASDDELDLLETYVGPAIFEDELQIVGKEHLGGEKVLAVNRTSSGILASVLALVEKGSHVSHFLAEFPAHPSIPRSCAIVGASYDEFIDIDEFTIPDNTSLVVVTGSTMDHKVIDEELFRKVIDMAHEMDIPVLVDDASGARLRTAVFNQAKATEIGADLVVTSTDKLMPGPRGGLMAGRKDLIDVIKVKANQFGLEAQPPLILAMVNGIKNYTEENLVKAISRKEEFYDLLSEKYEMFEKTPTGVMVSEDSLKNQLERLNVETELSQKDCCFLWAMILLKDFGIITIPAVGMPGASATIRIDLSTQDVIDMDLNQLYEQIDNSFDRFLDLSQDVEKSKELIFY